MSNKKSDAYTHSVWFIIVLERVSNAVKLPSIYIHQIFHFCHSIRNHSKYFACFNLSLFFYTYFMVFFVCARFGPFIDGAQQHMGNLIRWNTLHLLWHCSELLSTIMQTNFDKQKQTHVERIVRMNAGKSNGKMQIQKLHAESERK